MNNKKINNNNFFKELTKKVALKDLPIECFAIRQSSQGALLRGFKVDVIIVHKGMLGYYNPLQYLGDSIKVNSFDQLNTLNKAVYNVSNLNIVDVMYTQSLFNVDHAINNHNRLVDIKASNKGAF